MPADIRVILRNSDGLALRLGGCYAFVDHGTRVVETHFPDGTVLVACPEDDDDYRRTARDCGYGEDVWALCREHELIHQFLAVRMGLDCSPTLWSVHHRDDPAAPDAEARATEEWLVLCFQRWLNGGLPDEVFGLLGERGLDVIALRDEARRLLRGGQGG